MTIIKYWAETGPRSLVATSHGQNMVVRGHGVAHNVQQNATKLTKMHQNSYCTITEQNFEFVLCDLCDPLLE